MPKIKSAQGRTELLNAIVDDFDRQKAETYEKIKKLLPAGTRVTWTTQRSGNFYEQSGEVLWVCSHDIGEVRVLNRATGKQSGQHLGRYGTLRLESPNE